VPRPTRKTNGSLVLDCVKWHLLRINRANGNYWDGLVVDMDQSPVALAEGPRADDFNRLGAIVSVREGGQRRDREKSTANNVKRQRVNVELHCLVGLTQEAQANGWSLSDLRRELVHDVSWELQPDSYMAVASQALGIVPKASCHNFLVDDVIVDPKLLSYPTSRFVILCSYEYDDKP